MPAFSEVSAQRLATCHPDLIRLFSEIIKSADCSVLCGHRGKDDQERAFLMGNSKLRWPASRHNSEPSRAIDVMPYPVDWQYTPALYYFAGYVMRTADELGIGLRWGGSWTSGPNRHKIVNVLFKDLPHYELCDDEGGDK